MEWAAFVVLMVFSLIGFLAVFFTTIGTLVIFIGAVLFAAMTGFSVFTVKTLLVLATLYLAGEVMEYALTILGTKRMGGSNAAVLGALLGGLLGAGLGFSMLGIGVFLGTVLGLFLGAFVVELVLQRDWRRSLKAGAGGVLGRLAAIGVKVVIACVMFGIMAVHLWAHWRQGGGA